MDLPTFNVVFVHLVDFSIWRGPLAAGYEPATLNIVVRELDLETEISTNQNFSVDFCFEPEIFDPGIRMKPERWSGPGKAISFT